MQASDLMTRNVVTVREGASIGEGVRLMLQWGISGLPVVDTMGGLVGIVTEGDFLRRSEMGTERRRPRWLAFLLGTGRLAEEYMHTHARKVAEVMTTEVQTIAEDTPVSEIVGIMEKYRIKRLPVLRNGAIVGIVSRANLIRALANFADQIPTTSDSDLDIRDYLLDEIAKQPWAPRATVENVTVHRGLVHLSGHGLPRPRATGASCLDGECAGRRGERGSHGDRTAIGNCDRLGAAHPGGTAGSGHREERSRLPR